LNNYPGVLRGASWTPSLPPRLRERWRLEPEPRGRPAPIALMRQLAKALKGRHRMAVRACRRQLRQLRQCHLAVKALPAGPPAERQNPKASAAQLSEVGPTRTVNRAHLIGQALPRTLAARGVAVVMATLPATPDPLRCEIIVQAPPAERGNPIAKVAYLSDVAPPRTVNLAHLIGCGMAENRSMRWPPGRRPSAATAHLPAGTSPSSRTTRLGLSRT